MPIPREEAYWIPVARKILYKKPKQQLPLEKVVRKLCRRGARTFRLEQSDKDLQQAVHAFISAARASGSLVHSGNFLRLSNVASNPMHTEQKAALSSDATPDDGHPAGDGLKPKAKVPTQPISQPEAKGHRKYKRKLPTAVGDFQTPQLDDGLVRKTEKKKPDDKAGDRVMQPPQSSAKAQSGPASNALSHPTSVEKGKKKKKKEKQLRNKQALLRQSVTGDSTDAIVCTEQEESRMVKKPRKGQASEQDAAGSAAGLETESKRQSVPVREQNPEEAKAIKQAETGTTADVNNADSMPGIPGASTSAMTWRELDKRTDVKRGRFSQTEKETLLEAIKEYARMHSLSESDLSWIYSTRNNRGGSTTAEDHAARKSAWMAIAQALPHRTPKSVWAFATRTLHEGNHLGKWPMEDAERLLELHAERGNRWKEIGAALGRLPETCRDKYRDLALAQARQTGKWSPEEEGKLNELVTRYMEQRPEPAADSGRLLIDAINWDVVSQQHGTRNPKACRQKWYDSLAPSMVSRGDWGIGDDRRLLKALLRGSYSTEWQVDWSELIPQRTAAAAKRRWRLMLKSVPDHQEKDFAGIVDELVTIHLPVWKQKWNQGAAPPQE